VLKSKVSQIKQNFKKIKGQINLHADKVGRKAEEIEIVAVTKGRSLEEIKEVLGCGVNMIGENRVQEAKEKFGQLGNFFEWHLVGHLQTNKVKSALEMFELIHSVDSLRLAEEINQRAGQLNKTQKILVQVNTSGEITKFGLAPENLPEFLKKISNFKNIFVEGLMTMAPFCENSENSRPHFQKLKEIFEETKKNSLAGVKMKWLSMGMSQDYVVAVEEGANLLRIGSAIFEKEE
jgi:pyridoxal phosphate enzyme (YggS family)